MEITYNKKWISHLGIMASALSSVHSFPPIHNQNQINRCIDEMESCKKLILNAIKENNTSPGEIADLNSMKSLIKTVIDELKDQKLPEWTKDYFTFFENSFSSFCDTFN